MFTNYKKAIRKRSNKSNLRRSNLRNIITSFFVKQPKHEEENKKMIVDYPWYCSLELLSGLESIKLDGIYIQCALGNRTRNFPDIERTHDTQNVKSFLVTIHKNLSDIVKEWFKPDTVIETENKTIIYQFLYWIKENNIAKIMTDVIINSLGKRKYKIKFNSESFVIDTFEHLSNRDIETILSQLKLLNFVSKKWMRECTISIDRIFQGMHLLPCPQQPLIMDNIVYKLKICLNTKQLYDLDTMNTRDFSTDIYALHDNIFKS